MLSTIILVATVCVKLMYNYVSVIANVLCQSIKPERLDHKQMCKLNHIIINTQTYPGVVEKKFCCCIEMISSDQVGLQ